MLVGCPQYDFVHAVQTGCRQVRKRRPGDTGRFLKPSSFAFASAFRFALSASVAYLRGRPGFLGLCDIIVPRHIAHRKMQILRTEEC